MEIRRNRSVNNSATIIEIPTVFKQFPPRKHRENEHWQILPDTQGRNKVDTPQNPRIIHKLIVGVKPSNQFYEANIILIPKSWIQQGHHKKGKLQANYIHEHRWKNLKQNNSNQHQEIQSFSHIIF